MSKSRQLISRWKSTWNWDERVRAYDTALEREAHKEAVKNLKDMTSRHIKIAVQLQNKALEALQRVKVEDMSPRDIREYIKLATDGGIINIMEQRAMSCYLTSKIISEISTTT